MGTANPGNLWNREPALIVAAVQALVGLAVSFGLDLTGEQVGAIMAATAALLGVIARRKVSPVYVAPTEPDPISEQ